MLTLLILMIQPSQKCIRGDDRDKRWISVGVSSGIIDLNIMADRVGGAIALDAEILKARVWIDEQKKKLKLTKSHGP